MKDFFCILIGAFSSIIASLFGGWDAAIQTLLIFMLIDYLTGMVVAGVFQKSRKTKSGALKSSESFKGLVKKCMMLVFVIVGVRLDILINTTYIRDGICIACTVNELISIIENGGLMGVPIPKQLINAIDVLNSLDSGETQR